MRDMSRNTLENAEFYTEVLLGILAEVVDEFRSFAGELIEVRSGLIDVIEERFVRYEFAEGSFARPRIAENRVDLGRSGVEFCKSISGVVIELFVLEEFSERTTSGTEISRNQFEVVSDAVDLRRRGAQVDDRRSGLVIERVVSYELPGTAAS